MQKNHDELNIVDWRCQTFFLNILLHRRLQTANVCVSAVSPGKAPPLLSHPPTFFMRISG